MTDDLAYSSAIEDALHRLNYSIEWVTLGALTEEIARIQVKAFSEPGADPHDEHYRLGALRTYFDKQDFLSDNDLELLLAIARQELTKGLGEHVFHELADWPLLMDGQFTRIAASHSSRSFDRLLERLRLIRRIKNNDKNAIDEAMHSGDPVLMCWLVDHAPLDPTQLEHLSLSGRSKAIRNLARLRLKIKCQGR